MLLLIVSLLLHWNFYSSYASDWKKAIAVRSTVCTISCSQIKEVVCQFKPRLRSSLNQISNRVVNSITLKPHLEFRLRFSFSKSFNIPFIPKEKATQWMWLTAVSDLYHRHRSSISMEFTWSSYIKWDEHMYEDSLEKLGHCVPLGLVGWSFYMWLIDHSTGQRAILHVVLILLYCYLVGSTDIGWRDEVQNTGRREGWNWEEHCPHSQPTRKSGIVLCSEIGSNAKPQQLQRN